MHYDTRSLLARLKTMLQNILLLILVSLVIIYLGGMAFAYLVADKMIFPYSSTSYSDSEELIKVKSADGEQIAALYLKGTSDKLLLFSHGNGEDIGSIRELLASFQSNGISVFAYDYPGYGQSSGSASENGVYASADAAYRYVTESLGYQPPHITLYGRSLGSGPSCWLAERYPVAGMILDGAFSSTFRVMTKIRLLPWDHFNNISRFDSIECPVLILHGKQDRTVPFAHALQNEKAVRSEVATLWSETAGHNDLIEQLGRTYWDTVIEFIKQDSND